MLAGPVAELPSGPVTTRSTSPIGWAGAVTSSLVGDWTASDVPTTPPKVTLVAPVKPEPVTVTRAPPDVELPAGVRPVTAGGPGAAPAARAVPRR